MAGVGRIGDPFDCGDFIAAGSPDVFINWLPVGRLNDATTGHGCYNANAVASANNNKVFANGIQVAIVGITKDQSHCCGPHCHVGTLIDGSPDVFIG